jgi:hypothetical protein
MQTTIIHSNGSKWAGEQPDSIDILIERLSIYTIEDRFFCKFKERYNSTQKHVICPISKVDGNYMFFGNFEEISGVFRIETNCPDTIKKLRVAIMNNAGWKMYISKCKQLEAA